MILLMSAHRQPKDSVSKKKKKKNGRNGQEWEKKKLGSSSLSGDFATTSHTRFKDLNRRLVLIYGPNDAQVPQRVGPCTDRVQNATIAWRDKSFRHLDDVKDQSYNVR
jgi:hypothetical protein